MLSVGKDFKIFIENTSINQEAKLVHSKIKKDKPMDKEEATIKRQSQHILAQSKLLSYFGVDIKY